MQGRRCKARERTGGMWSRQVPIGNRVTSHWIAEEGSSRDRPRICGQVSGKQTTRKSAIPRA